MTKSAKLPAILDYSGYACYVRRSDQYEPETLFGLQISNCIKQSKNYFLLLQKLIQNGGLFSFNKDLTARFEHLSRFFTGDFYPRIDIFPLSASLITSANQDASRVSSSEFSARMDEMRRKTDSSGDKNP